MSNKKFKGDIQKSKGYQKILQWMKSRSMHPFPYQEACWQAIQDGKSGLVNAPTGFGKTYSVFLGALIQFLNQDPGTTAEGVQIIWITPLRALSKDIARAMQDVLETIGIPWKVGIRNGDTPAAERVRQKKKMPEILVITPESLHLLFTQKNAGLSFRSVRVIAVDEWHELMGSKRGIQVELALSKIIAWNTDRKKELSCWGISATIGNLQEAMDVLLSPVNCTGELIRAKMNKKIEVCSILPDEIETYPWAGHLGLTLVHQIIPIIKQHTSTLIFINTRGMSERWYQAILDEAPDLAGVLALHHGSIDQELRLWVEESLHAHKLKAVVCTASLDLGVDFRPVEAVIQVGSPKGVSRFLQRAGRSGHQPDALSKIYFLPTHSLELVEAAALRQAIKEELYESKPPLLLCYDVLIQYLTSLAVGDGFFPEIVYQEIKTTHCYKFLETHEWKALIHFLLKGGQALEGYDDYQKFHIEEDGRYTIRSRKLAMRHRMNIGTIVSEGMLKVKLMNGNYIGVIEEWFISRLEPGDCFTLAGKNLELVHVKEMTAYTKTSRSGKTIVPSWQGGRMSLTANLGKKLRESFEEIADRNRNDLYGKSEEPEFNHLQTLFTLQQKLSHIPGVDEILIELHHSRDGQHLLVYPFEGRQVHEAMSALLAFRIGKLFPVSFSIAMNDYGFELLSDRIFELDTPTFYKLFSTENLLTDLQKSMNATEMARRKFRDIAVIGGLIFQTTPGQNKKPKHLQASAGLLFNVFQEYDPQNLLLRQAYQEVIDQQFEEERMRIILSRICKSKIILKEPHRFTPLSFPIIADGLNRNHLSTEKLEDRIRRMQLQLKEL